MRTVTYPFLVMGPDIHGPTIYARCKTLAHAKAYAKGMERHWTILRVLSAGDDLLAEADATERASVETVRDLQHARELATRP